MAPKKTTTKTSNTRKRKYNRQNQAKVKETGAVQDEIILVITLVISILLFLSNFNMSGKVGSFFSGITFGLVGLQAYILPFLLFFMMAFHISNVGNKRAGRKMISAFILLIALAALLELMTNPFVESKGIFDYYNVSSENRNGGGIIGGLFVILFCKLFDVVATYVILIAVMIICILVISGKAIFTYIAQKGKVTFKERKEYQKLRREEQELEVIEEKPAKKSRRPPKTFVLNPAEAVQTENNQTRKTDNPILKMNPLPMENEPVKNDSFAIMDNAMVPTYEDELRSKFGDSEENVWKDEEEVKTPDSSEPIITKEKKPERKTSNSTDVEDINISQTAEEKEYKLPPASLLSSPRHKGRTGNTEKDLKDTAMKLQTTLESFGVRVTITNVSVGPAVTRYELQPEQGVKVSKITSLADDIKLNLAASEIRIEAPIPGKAAVGIEVPNKENSMVAFKELIESKGFEAHPSDVAFAVGKDIGGQTVITDIAKMPHLLIAGATGSGKSVCINTLIMSILYKSKPSDVRMIMIDPKVVELNVYNGIPHLLIPVVTDPKKASAALNWAVVEMTERYKKFADIGVKDIKGYNEKVSEVAYLEDETCQKLPQIVIVIDELADLMMVAPGEVEDAICRLAQLARAAGIHLVIATQRPSVNVITGLIKANIPSRIAFAVSSQIDSRTILDGSGAEKLLGKGDMLFFPSGYPKPVRIQGAFVSEKEVAAVVDFLKMNNSEAEYSDDIHEKINNAKASDGSSQGSTNDRDEYFTEAGKFIIEKDKASIGMLQRVYKIGFNRAARIMDQLAEAGVVGPEEGTKPRKVIMSQEQFEQYLEEY